MGGIDSVIPYEHWTCVPPFPPRTSNYLGPGNRHEFLSLP